MANGLTLPQDINQHNDKCVVNFGAKKKNSTMVCEAELENPSQND